LKSQALYKTVDNRNTLAQQNALIAKRLDESLAALNKLYEANRKHHLEFCDMKRQIKHLEEEKAKLQEQLQSAQACKYLILILTIISQ
jgi:predicted nuclease with TOPRIM domain